MPIRIFEYVFEVIPRQILKLFLVLFARVSWNGRSALGCCRQLPFLHSSLVRRYLQMLSSLEPRVCLTLERAPKHSSYNLERLCCSACSDSVLLMHCCSWARLLMIRFSHIGALCSCALLLMLCLGMPVHSAAARSVVCWSPCTGAALICSCWIS